MKHLLEICVDSVESALEAQAGGAQRLELCANLIIGGTSPTMPMIHQVLQQVNIPVNVLLRPRFGDFCFTSYEKTILLEEIAQCRQLGAHGVVIGALTPQGDLDEDFLSQCIEQANGMYVTLHRAFDLCREPFEALEKAIALGFDCILTSGQQATALQGISLLEQLVQCADGRIDILAGSGVSPENIPALAQKGIRCFHFSAKKACESPMIFRKEGVPMGLPVADEYLRQYTSKDLVQAAQKLLESL